MGADHDKKQEGIRFLIPIDQVKDNTYIIAFGVNNVEGYEATKFYARVSDTDTTIQFTIDPTRSDYCQLQVTDNPHVWGGVPFSVKITDTQHIDLYDWIKQYSQNIIISGYDRFTHGNFAPTTPDGSLNEGDPRSDLESNNITIETTVYEIKQLANGKGFQMIGGIRAFEKETNTPLRASMKYLITFYQRPDVPMVGRVGDTRVGYFYDNFRIDTKEILTGNPVAVINRKNLQKTPWLYIIDRTIPEEYHHAVKSGILSWNKYFKALKLGEPFQVLCYDDENYPEEEIDVFDTKASYIVGTYANNFNGPYSGYSMSIHDYRSGEALFGMVSLNLIKMVSLANRYIVMHGYEPKDSDKFKKDIEQWISWISAHEIGHQLGLRHNFTGTFNKGHISTVMDYVDVFNDLTSAEHYNPWGTLRDYDLISIEYGYTPLADEQTGTKHPTLDKIASKLTTPFGTDENYLEHINPLVSTTEDTDNPLDFVEKILPLYHTYRENLLNFVKNKTITPFEYNNIFVYLYTQKYTDIADSCLKYIGGRYYDQDRTYFIPIDKDTVLRAVRCLLHLLKEIEYTNEEYQYFIYDYDFENNRQLFNRVKVESIYSMNTNNLYYFYQSNINHILKGLTSFQNNTRLFQNTPNTFTPTDLLRNFSFAFIPSDVAENIIEYDIHDIDGIFPEIGSILVHDSKWQNLLLEFSPLKCNVQYNWVERLLLSFQKTDSYLVKSATYTILKDIYHSTTQHILPYLSSIKGTSTLPHRQMVEHWTFLEYLIKQVLTDRVTK